MTTPGSGDQPQNPGQNAGQGWGQQPPSGPDQSGQQGGQQWAAPGGQPQQPGQQYGQPQPGQPYGQPQPGPDQGQPGQPQQFGQPGQPGQFGQPQYGQPGQPGQFGQPQYGQPGQPGQPWAGQQFSGEAPKKERPAWQKRLPLVIGAVVVALVVAAVRGGFGGGAPEVGDCVQASDSDGYEVVDCDSDEAQYRIFGTDADMSEAEFSAAQDVCLEAATESGITDGVSLWYGNTGDDGQVFCAETL